MNKVVILAGGKGTRLKEKTQDLPKPMLLVGKVPILQHIINRYVFGGFTDFVVPVGHLGVKVECWFRQNYMEIRSDNTMDSSKYTDGKITVQIVYTGLDTMTGGRLLRLKNYLGDDPFMMTYGDGMSNINPKYVKELGNDINKNIITAVHPVPRFGSLVISPNDEVMSFSEKQISSSEWINGGYLYLKPEDIFPYIKSDLTNFEKDVLPKLVWESKLHAFRYEGVWHCIDTLRDLELAEEMLSSGVFK